MRFQTLAIIPLMLNSALSIAVPGDAVADTSDAIQFPTGNAFTALPHEVLTTALSETDDFNVSCILSCGIVLGAAACIGIAIEEGNTAIAAKCLKGGASKLCPCANCIPGLKAFVTKHHIC